MKRLLYLVGIFVFCTLSSCFHDWVTPASSLAKGEWQWLYSVGGIGGDTVQPSAKAIISLDLNNDSTYVLYQGAGVVDSGKYSMHTINGNQSILRFNHSLTVDKLYLQPEQLIIEKDSAALHLFDYNITDGFDHHFKKAN